MPNWYAKIALKLIRVCNYCGKTFKKHKGPNKYCSLECKRKKRNEQQKLTRKPRKRSYGVQKESIMCWRKKHKKEYNAYQKIYQSSYRKRLKQNADNLEKEAV